MDFRIDFTNRSILMADSSFPFVTSLSAAAKAVIRENLVVERRGGGMCSPTLSSSPVLPAQSCSRDTIKTQFGLRTVPKEALMTTAHHPRPQATSEVPAVPLTTE